MATSLPCTWRSRRNCSTPTPAARDTSSQPSPTSVLRSPRRHARVVKKCRANGARASQTRAGPLASGRSEEHTSELQSQFHLVCRLLLEKKKKKKQERHRQKERKQ